MKLKPGTTDHFGFSNSMAEAMRDALYEHRPPEMVGRSLFLREEHLRWFLVAIAQGVVRHLEENYPSFNVEVRSGSGTWKGKVSSIETIGVRPPAGR